TSRAIIGRRIATPIRHPQTKEVLYSDHAYISPKVFADIQNYEWGPAGRVHIHVPLETLSERLNGRVLCEDVIHPETGEVMISTGETIPRAMADTIEKSGRREVKIRSILTCKLGRGVCAKCYGLDLATNQPVEIGEAVGIIAAQSIGEPGT